MDPRQGRVFNKDGAHTYVFLAQTIAGESHANLPVYFCFGGGRLPLWPRGIGQTGTAGAPEPDHSVFIG